MTRATLTIDGCDIDPQATVTLTRSGELDIVGFNVVGVPTRTRISATFDLQGSTPGLWDVVVMNSGGSQQVLPAAFEVLPGGNSDLFVDVIVPTVVRPFREYALRVDYGNDGTVDLPGRAN